MATGILSNNFSQTFCGLLEERGVSCYQIGKYSGLDQAYLSRLKSGGRSNPSPETIMKISLALAHLSPQISLYDIQKLFRSAGRLF